MVMRQIEQAVIWRRADAPGHDVCTYGPTDAGWRLHGSALFVSGGTPSNIGYLVDADGGWRCRSAHVFGTIGTELVDVFITAREGGPWLLNGRPQSRTSGCLDLDFGFTPATKLFILRRLALAIGGKQHSNTVAQLVLPGLTLEPMEQRYQRLSAGDYVLAAGNAKQSTVLSVDQHQSVVLFPGLWERESSNGADAAHGTPPGARPTAASGRRPEEAVAV
jgi:hypothetical protein